MVDYSTKQTELINFVLKIDTGAMDDFVQVDFTGVNQYNQEVNYIQSLKIMGITMDAIDMAK